MAATRTRIHPKVALTAADTVDSLDRSAGIRVPLADVSCLFHHPCRQGPPGRQRPPPRVRELLGALIGLCRQTLAAPLILTVEALEQMLHDADRARNPMQQADLMAQRGQLHAFAGHFADRMLDAVAEALAGLREPSTASAAHATPPPLPGMLGLSLVDEHEVDRDLLLTEMVRRETLRSTNC